MALNESSKANDAISMVLLVKAVVLYDGTYEMRPATANHRNVHDNVWSITSSDFLALSIGELEE